MSCEDAKKCQSVLRLPFESFLEWKALSPRLRAAYILCGAAFKKLHRGVGRIFCRGFQWWNFPGVAKKISWAGAKSCKISFCPLETKQTTFFAKILLRKCQISNSLTPLPPLRRTCLPWKCLPFRWWKCDSPIVKKVCKSASCMSQKMAGAHGDRAKTYGNTVVYRKEACTGNTVVYRKKACTGNTVDAGQKYTVYLQFATATEHRFKPTWRDVVAMETPTQVASRFLGNAFHHFQAPAQKHARFFGIAHTGLLNWELNNSTPSLPTMLNMRNADCNYNRRPRYAETL